MDSMRTGRPTACNVDDVAGWCERMWAVAANAEAEDVDDETAGRWPDALLTEVLDTAGRTGEGDACRADWRGNAREWGGRRDSTIDRIVSQSMDVHPSRESVDSFGQTHVCETGGAAKF